MISFRKSNREIPPLNTASLPDLIFTVLFFFMIVTHMRQVTPQVRYQEPQGTELTRQANRSNVITLLIGRAPGSEKHNYQIQINNRLVPVDQIAERIMAEKNRMSPEDVSRLVVSIRADKQVPMGLIMQVKQSLRQANALRVSYAATETAAPSTPKRQ